MPTTKRDLNRSRHPRIALGASARALSRAGMATGLTHTQKSRLFGAFDHEQRLVGLADDDGEVLARPADLAVHLVQVLV